MSNQIFGVTRPLYTNWRKCFHYFFDFRKCLELQKLVSNRRFWAFSTTIWITFRAKIGTRSCIVNLDSVLQSDEFGILIAKSTIFWTQFWSYTVHNQRWVQRGVFVQIGISLCEHNLPFKWCHHRKTLVAPPYFIDDNFVRYNKLPRCPLQKCTNLSIQLIIIIWPIGYWEDLSLNSNKNIAQEIICK